MTGRAPLDLGSLGLDAGGQVLLALALEEEPIGSALEVRGLDPALPSQLRAWCTRAGHGFEPAAGEVAGRVVRRAFGDARWSGAERSGKPDPATVAAHAPASSGLAARGAWIEAGGPAPTFALDDKDAIWADDAPRLYERALGAQWDPATIPWDRSTAADPRVERAVARVMAYLVENEHAALVVPARFLARVHPYFAEVQHLLAQQVADEARHAHVFARRARLDEHRVLSGAGGRASLQTLLDEPDFGTAMFLLGVLGEGTFLSLLAFLERHAPDDCTRAIARLVRADEARHVAFGVGHLERRSADDPGLRSRLAAAVEGRHDALRSTTGLDRDVHDSLVLLAAGAPTPDAVARGWIAVQEMTRDMQDGRETRLARLGFTPGEAEALSALHTRNFM
jgi:hypothetical protein